MAHIVIDGYNYIGRAKSADVYGDTGLDTDRRALIERLFRFKRQKGGKITVVFDAYNTFSAGRQREIHKGVDVVYSNQNETADDVIIGWIRKKQAGMVVVTSDRAIIDEAKTHGVAFLTPVALAGMMAESHSTAAAYGKDDDDSDSESYGKKRGNPRKLPKKLRKVVKTIDKL